MAQRNRKAASELNPRVIAELRRAQESRSTYIDLRKCGLTHVPDELFELTNLEHIDVSGNRLKTVTETVWKLPKLNSVDLIGNPIESLPNRPGLIIDGPTYLRFHNKIDAQYFELVIDPDTSQEVHELLVADLRSAPDLRAPRILGERGFSGGRRLQRAGWRSREFSVYLPAWFRWKSCG